MNCEILCIGTEILHGDITNTNATFISKNLANIGIDVHYHSVVGDNPTRMKKAFSLAFSRADLVICTGGLGPTQDDITKDILSEYFKKPLIYDEKSFEHLKLVYSKHHTKMPENNLRQAYFPKDSIILKNNNGTANACIVNECVNDKRKIGILLPGPPNEMKPLMTEAIIPYLSKFSNCVVTCKKVAVVKLGESKAETLAMDLIKNQTNPTIATYASSSRTIFRITAKAKNKDEAISLINPVADELLKRFGDNAFLLEDNNFEEQICKNLITSNLTISTAESCTGGLIASKLINCSGISKILKESYITYSNESKINILGVSKESIEKYTEYSLEVAKEMAYGVAKLTNSDIGLSTTGIAGPLGGTKEKPVGLVYCCAYYNGKYKITERVFTGDRQSIREKAACATIALIPQIITLSPDCDEH